MAKLDLSDCLVLGLLMLYLMGALVIGPMPKKFAFTYPNQPDNSHFFGVDPEMVRLYNQ